MELNELLELRDAANAAIRSKRSLDKCHDSYIKSTSSVGFSRARTTTYNANAANKAASFKSDMKHLQELCRSAAGI